MAPPVHVAMQGRMTAELSGTGEQATLLLEALDSGYDHVGSRYDLSAVLLTVGDGFQMFFAALPQCGYFVLL